MKTLLTGPCIAIVRGGFDGIRAQMKLWALEREVEHREAGVERLQRELEQARTLLAGKRTELARHGAMHSAEQTRLAQVARDLRPAQSMRETPARRARRPIKTKSN